MFKKKLTLSELERVDTALNELNNLTQEVMLVMRKGDGDMHRFAVSAPTSRAGNFDTRSPKSVDVKDQPLAQMWVAGHGALRSYAETIGEMLDRDALLHKEDINQLEKKFLTQREAYYRATKAILQDAKQPHHHLKARWLNGLNKHGEPKIKIPQDLIDLRKRTLNKQNEALWDELTRIRVEYDMSFQQLKYMFLEEPYVPLTWRSEDGTMHHTNLTITQKDAGDMCWFLYAAKLVGMKQNPARGLTSPLAYTSDIVYGLRNTLDTSRIMRNISNNILQPAIESDNADLQDYLAHSFLRNPYMKKITQALEGLNNSGQEWNLKGQDRAFKNLPSLEPAVCPFGHGASEEPQKHWCVKVLEDAAYIPQAHGYAVPAHGVTR